MYAGSQHELGSHAGGCISAAHGAWQAREQTIASWAGTHVPTELQYYAGI